MREIFSDEVLAYMREYGLPAMPDYYDGPGARDLILFRQNEERVTLTQCTLADAQEYCTREDTHGDTWFVGFDRANDEDEEEDDEARWQREQDLVTEEYDGSDDFEDDDWDEDEDPDIIPDGSDGRGYDPTTSDGPDPEGFTRPSYGD